MLSVIMLSVIMLNVIMLSVIMLSVIMLSVIMPSVVTPTHHEWLICDTQHKNTQNEYTLPFFLRVMFNLLLC